MLIENKKLHLFVGVILTVALISASVFVSYGTNEVSAKESTAAKELQEIEDLTLEAEPEAPYDGYIVKVEDSATDKVDENALEDYQSTPDNEYVVVDEPEDALDFVEPEYLDYIEPNYKRYPAALNKGDGERYYMKGAVASSRQPSALGQLNGGAYGLINAPAAWQRSNGSGSNVAVLDTGLSQHEGLEVTHVKKLYNFINTYINNGYYKNGTDDVRDNYGHGTFVTGLIAARKTDYANLVGDTYTFQGIAPASNLYIGKILTNDGGSVGDFIIALRTLALLNGYDDIDVLNMSFGGEGFSNTEYAELRNLTAKGVVAVAAAGNEGDDGSPLNYPANYPNVIGVGATDDGGNVPYWSTQNSSVLLAAPGNSLYSFGNYAGGLVQGSGTSFSTPLVTGAVALLRNINGNITQNQILTLIKQTSNNQYKNNKGSFDKASGYGILDVGEMAAITATGTIPNSYQISYRVEDCNLTGTIPTIHTYGTTTTLPRSVTKKGYRFSHWVDQYGVKRLSIPAYYTAPYAGDGLILNPVFISNKYQLRFKGNGGKVRARTKAVYYGSAITTIKTPKKRKGYNFLGWYTKKRGGTQYYRGKKYALSRNLTLYAHWTRKKVVRFNGNRGVVKKYAKAITRGKKYGTLPKPTRKGYVFRGWYTKKSKGKRVTKNRRVRTKGNTVLYAHWKKRR